MHLKADTLLQGDKYRIISTLGQGGFGITYLAEQVLVKRKVCIKEFFPKEYYKRDDDSSAATLMSDGFAESMNRFKAKFIKEAQTIAALDHPNIIHIFEIFEENGTAYYVMEYVEGESLSDKVKRSGAMDEAEAIGYIHQIAEALGYIHSEQIMHLDVKPANVMVRSRDNRAILIDFGLAKHYDTASGDATSTTPVGVSHGFAPMEQYKEGGVSTFSPETDIYSLGATLYYLVVGKVPPQAADVANDGLPELPAYLSESVKCTIDSAMQSRIRDRVHSVKEIIMVLDEDKVRETTKSTHKWWIWILLIIIAIGGYFAFLRHKDSNDEIVLQEDLHSQSDDSLASADMIVDADYAAQNAQQSSETDFEIIQDPTIDVSNKEAKTPNIVDDSHSTDTYNTLKNSINYPPNNQIWYTTSNNEIIEPFYEKISDDAKILRNTYHKNKGVFVFDKDITSICFGAFECTVRWDTSPLTSIALPSSITAIGDSAFYNCSELSNIIIPDGVETIGEYAFVGCHSITSITIPNSVKIIGEGAFGHCGGLSSFKGRFAEDNGRCLIINNKLIAFAANCGLTHYTIPSKIKSIGAYAFSNCSLISISIPENVTEIGSNSFMNCLNLTTITLPTKISNIPDYAFYNCENLRDITIPYNIKLIGNFSFNNCNSLTSITIPDSVTQIGNGVFANCGRLQTVFCKCKVPPIGGWNMFSYSDPHAIESTPIECTIYVPRESVEAYKNANGWKEYADQIVGYDFED